MKHAPTRGTALPETALTIGLSLLLVLGSAQMALIGYTQISADGAAFVAAHEQAQNPSINGASEGASVFSAFSSTNFTTPSPQPSLIPYSVTKSVGGFSVVPGLASTYSVTGKDVEYAPDNASATPAPYAFSVNATLLNYCDPHGNCSLPATRTIYLAQGVGTGNGNGANGIFSEWRCHQKYYASLNWPNAYPTGGYNGSIKGTQFDPYSNNSTENAIYGWDSNPKCN
jgi:hypothetical protein